MPPTIHLGVSDFPYRYERQRLGKRGQPLKRGRKVMLSATTGTVAERLEEGYGLMEKFFDSNEAWIGDQLNASVEKSLEALLSGAPVTHDPYGRAAAEIEGRFKQALAQQRFDNAIPGVPTLASKLGINHRLAHPYSKRNPKPRPSFIDTGEFQSSFKMWVE